MELLILFITLGIFAETTILVLRRYKPSFNNKRKIYVDTSVLIDGRILNVARSGFLDGDLIIPRNVLLELQLLADGKDATKRTRARAGLEVVSELERVENINTEIIDCDNERQKVDELLLKLAKDNKGVVLTLDYNLIKVAKAEKIETLNINELALAVRNEFLPGERIKLKITEKGSGRGQGVGHLKDGTMVVVGNAASRINQEVTVEFVKFYETTAGKMVFAKLAKKR